MTKCNFLRRQSLTKIRIRIVLASCIHIRACIEVKCWIRIRIETNADPQH
jgi:hypothetical protein